MSKPETKEVPILLVVFFIICGVAILILNIINYVRDGRIGTFSIFGFLIIFLGLWLYLQGKKSKADRS